MNNLFQRFSSLTRSYYGISINAHDLFDSAYTKDRCFDFINDHYIKGEKKKVFSIPHQYMCEYQENGKHEHTVSLFLLGLLMEDRFSTTIKNKMSSLIGGDLHEWYDFKYTWYLTCLYHDVISVIESNENYVNRIPSALNCKLYKENASLFRFSADTIEKYLQYRKKNGKNEHGIIAGIEIFDNLKTSFETNTKEHNWSVNPICRKGSLEWRQTHIPHFAYIADAVCCHNIWLAPAHNSTLKGEYQDNNLNSLIVNSETDRLYFSNFPLQFALCILDTIEPVKRFRHLTPFEILRNIDIVTTESGIKIIWTERIKEQPEFFIWAESIRTLSDWMGVTVSTCKCEDRWCSLTISFC